MRTRSDARPGLWARAADAPRVQPTTRGWCGCYALASSGMNSTYELPPIVADGYAEIVSS